MPLRDVLLVIDKADSVARRLALVGALAKHTPLRVTGLFATAMPSAAYADLNGWVQLMDVYLAAQREEAAKAEPMFRQEMARLKLAGDWIARETDFGGGVTAMARLHDLTVLGQPDPAATTPSVVRPDDVVLSAGGPLLVVPYAGDFADIGHRIVVAWSGTRESARALHDAMFLIEQAEAVAVLEVDRSDSDGGIAGLTAADVAAALNRRGVKATAQATVSDGTPVADVILSSAADFGADLIVMGAWGHSRLREFVLGGVSRGILREMTVPVLMSH